MIGQLVQKIFLKNAVEGLLSQGKPGDITQYGTPATPHHGISRKAAAALRFMTVTMTGNAQ